MTAVHRSPSLLTEARPALRILFVCTGNICRSPAAERLFRKEFGPRIKATSAGTYAMAGEPIAEPMAILLEGSGADPERFVARQLTPELLGEADLVLTMTLEQRAATVELLPRAVRHTFTFLQFARLLARVAPELLSAVPTDQRFAAAIPLAAAQQRQASTVEADDVVDPYLGSEADYSASFAQLETAVRVVVTALSL